MTERDTVADKAARLHAAFDQSFAAPPSIARDEGMNFLGIRIGASAYAIDLAEVSALFADKEIAALPSSASECLGVATLRGTVVPVYSLRAFLGHPPGAGRPRWLVRAGGVQVAAFAFDDLDGHLRIPIADITPAQGASFHGHVQASAVVDGKPRPIVSIRSLMDYLEQRLDPGSRRKEN